jgi:hypothetical protein
MNNDTDICLNCKNLVKLRVKPNLANSYVTYRCKIIGSFNMPEQSMVLDCSEFKEKIKK